MRRYPATLAALTLLVVGCGSESASPPSEADPPAGAAERGDSGPRPQPERIEVPIEATLCPAPSPALAKRLEGLGLARAERVDPPDPSTLRVVEIDGASRSMSSDHQATRVNVVVRDGVIERVDGLYQGRRAKHQNGISSPSRWRRIMCIATLTERSRTSSRLPGSFGSRARARPSLDFTQMQT